jgi:hypothetical protein
MSVNSKTTASQEKYEKLPSQNLSHFLPVLLTPLVHLYIRMSPQIFLQIQNGPNGILGAQG